MKGLLDHAHIYSVQSLSTVFNIVGHIVILTDIVIKTCGMNENVIATAIRSNKTETFGLVKKLYFALIHNIILIIPQI